MINSRQELKKYFLPVYLVWAFVSPSLILLVNPIPASTLFAFYALFGLIWPLTFVVYPAFYLSFQSENAAYSVFGINLAIPIFLIAWIGPVIHFVFAIVYHRRYLQKQSTEDKPISFLDYLSGYLS